MSSSPNQFTKDFVRKLAHIAKKNLKIKDGDYQKNEIWYCGKCNMPMQIKSGDELLCISCHCVGWNFNCEVVFRDTVKSS